MIAWAPDSKRIVYVSDRDGADHLNLYDFTSQTEQQLTREGGNDRGPRVSPDSSPPLPARNPIRNFRPIPRRSTTSSRARSWPCLPKAARRALEKPTILVVNQHSLSDAEDFAEGYRTLKLDKVGGEPTAGWIIYTGGRQLIDWSFLRLPRHAYHRRGREADGA